MSDYAMKYTYVESPVGRLMLAGNSEGLAEIRFMEGRHPAPPAEYWLVDERPFREAAAQLQEYFEGKSRVQFKARPQGPGIPASSREPFEKYHMEQPSLR